MIALNVYLTPKAGRAEDLQKSIKDKWIAAMAEQPGFLRAAMVTPFSDEELDKLGAAKPVSTYEVVSFWRTEQERLDWVARPIHDEVYAYVIDASEKLSHTLQTVEESWNM